MFKICVVLLQLCLIYSYAQNCPLFSCTSIVKEVVFEGERVICKQGVCNRYGDVADDNCEPCVEFADMCAKIATCDANKNVLLVKEGQTLECIPNYECILPNPTCAVCGRKVCETDKIEWKCNDADPTTFTKRGTIGHCEPGKICNKENMYPCDPCILPGLGKTMNLATLRFIRSALYKDQQ